MSEKAHLQTLFSYHWHTTDRLIEGAARLSEEDYGPLHPILFHMLLVSRSWRVSLETGQQPRALAAEDYPTRASIAAGFAAERAAWETLLEGLSEEAIGEEMAMRRYNGQQADLARWRVLHQVLLHGMQHHSELAQLLTERGQSPGNIDFILYR